MDSNGLPHMDQRGPSTFELRETDSNVGQKPPMPGSFQDMRPDWLELPRLNSERQGTTEQRGRVQQLGHDQLQCSRVDAFWH